MEQLLERILKTAIAFPDKAAAEDSKGILTYGRLDVQSAAISAALARSGFREGDAAGVYVPYTRDILTGMVSVLRAGGICVPLEEQYPEKRLNSILEDCEAKAVLTVRELWERKPLCAPGARIIFLDQQMKADGPIPSAMLMAEDAPALLLYTSGTSGKPKGILHSRRFLMHIADSINSLEEAEMNADTRSGVVASFVFVASQIFLWGTILRGGTICIAPEEARQDLESLHQFIRRASVTHIFLSSSLAAILAEHYDLQDVRVFAGGEKPRSFRAHSPGNRVFNSYGSTEMGGVMICRIFGTEEIFSVGKPSPGAKGMICDETLHPVTAGETGELLLSSEWMARQYYKEAKLSEEKWVRIDGKLWYRTGDRARCAEDGTFEILGRLDHMIKLRGFRIDTGEVEGQILQAVTRTGQTGVKAAVVVKKTVGGSEHLCCYYEADRELDRKAVSEELERSLPAYMLPHFWIRMDALPRNTNGKVMRSQLPQPEMDRKPLCAIDHEVTSRVVLTAAEVLGISGSVSPEEGFIDLGGTSLTAMELAQRLRERGIKVCGARILQLNVLGKIAEAADVAWEQFWTPEEYEKVRTGYAKRGEHIQKVLPLTPWQDKILYDRLLHPDRSGVPDTILLQLDSSVSREHLREALDILAEENEELRASIAFHEVSAARQVITDRKIPLEMIETETFKGWETEDMRQRLARAHKDPQYGSLMWVMGIHAGKETFLYVMANRIAIGKVKRRALLARMMAILESRYPDDTSIRGWREILEQGIPTEEADGTEEEDGKHTVALREGLPPEIYVYSENEGPKLVFIHTGNTGSEAYYRLAGRIRDQISFAVIEPFNLYHPAEAYHGIRAIASKYIEILKRYQPRGPYLLGGWCYGGVVAHEMACQLEQAGEEVRHLFLLDAHALGSQELAALSDSMKADVNRVYFETSPLFAELRAKGMLDAVVANASQVAEDLENHTPSLYRGAVTYFKPRRIPAGVSEESRKYWETMMGFSAGNYEHYCLDGKLRVILTPDEHDLMMADRSLNIIVPEMLKDIGPGNTRT